MIQVKNNPHLYRDEKSGAIINCDDRAYNEYVNTLNQNQPHMSFQIKLSTRTTKTFNLIHL